MYESFIETLGVSIGIYMFTSASLILGIYCRAVWTGEKVN